MTLKPIDGYNVALEMSDSEFETLQNFLRAARDHYTSDAGTSAEAGCMSMANQFERQAHEANALAEFLNEYDGVEMNLDLAEIAQ